MATRDVSDTKKEIQSRFSIKLQLNNWYNLLAVEETILKHKRC